MIKCFVTMCMVANPTMCQPPVQIQPDDGHPITSQMECARGAFVYFSQGRIQQQTPEHLQDGRPDMLAWFPKLSSELEGDGSDIVKSWVDEEKRRAVALQPQIK